MRIAHFSDTHLGYIAYSRLVNGINQREIDVFKTFERNLDSICDADVDVVIHAGDFFDRVRPSNHTIVNAYKRMNKFQGRRGWRPFVIVAGNHETPSTADSGNILRLFGDPSGTGGIPGVHVFCDGIASVEIVPGLSLMAIPSRGLSEVAATTILPAGGSNVGVLVAHGLDVSLKLPSANFDARMFRPSEWSYMALGDYHVHRALSKNVVYSGSTDYTSSNIWEEVGTPKGWCVFDSDRGTVEFIEVEPVRGVFDLPLIDATGLDGAEISRRLEANATWPPEQDPIVRQRVRGVHPSARKGISGSVLRELKSRCAFYRLALETEIVEPGGASESAGPRSIDHAWTEYAAQYSLPADIDRARFAERGAQLIKESQDETAEA